MVTRMGKTVPEFLGKVILNDFLSYLSKKKEKGLLVLIVHSDFYFMPVDNSFSCIIHSAEIFVCV